MIDESNNQPGVRVTFSLPLGGAQLNASAVVPAGRTTLTALLPIIQNLENVITAKASEEANAAGTPISCGPGCGACCRQLVPVSLFEAEALTRWMRSLPEEQRSALEARFHRALLALRDAGVIDKLVRQDWTTQEEAAAELAIDYFHAAVPCPFLENESCSIHPIRPLSCREYMVTSPPELCRDPSIHQISGVQLPVKLSRALFRYGAEMEHDARGWLPLVFLLAWGRSGATPGDHVAGTGEEVLRGFLEKALGSAPTEAAESA
ncbi:MAG: YkgJ family cysteine cluster protein [Acidobacteriaceae bacterium]